MGDKAERSGSFAKDLQEYIAMCGRKSSIGHRGGWENITRVRERDVQNRRWDDEGGENKIPRRRPLRQVIAVEG